MNNDFELARTRDFSALINDSFQFIKLNFKPLLRGFFTFCGFFVLASAATTAVYLLQINDWMQSAQEGQYGNSLDMITKMKQFGLVAVVMFLFNVLTYSAVTVYVLVYIILYKEKGKVPPSNEEIWGYFKYYFFKVFGAVLLNGLLCGIASIFCLVPGIWLFPILALTFPVMIMENARYGYAFNQGFNLIKGNWWTTFGALFIMMLIAGISAGVISLPGTLWNQFALLLHWPGGNIAAILSALLSHLALVLYILPLVTLALCYFSLNEAKEGTGLMERINKLGEENNDNNLPAEEY
ncbi:hypothetical protein [Mucilaginibacter auburnensis]|uniref:Glycerophosphoryl diester phosphodiesterase family protein n=1 Tax=Mucilaginibacter auburnensis TaxID=1457233 RepID=A0A2H9VSP9_9SPHI|nr:hypothetical protein [Mucilaginibacter auburnensis]PJJ83835.1 hypothetical protein CLV57_0830 [Mucilaginibacter auburnensis]